MIFLLSPAKTLDYETQVQAPPSTEPRFLEHSQELIEQLGDLSASDIGSLMKLSDKLSELNYQRFQSWGQLHNEGPECRHSLLAFKGDVYQGLDAANFSEQDFLYAQDHLRILSGLYGILRPLDLMRPYRLEMGTKFANKRGKNLYEFWGNILTESINSEAPDAVVNLASNEYFSALKKKNLTAPIITPVFKDYKNGKYKIISFYAKKARGTMAAWALKNRIDSPKQLQQFAEDGYQFDPESSDATTLTFLRNIEA